MEMTPAAFTQFGLAGVLLFIVFFILKWMMRMHEKVLDTFDKDRDKTYILMDSLKERIDAGTRAQGICQEQMLEAFRREREEHAVIIRGIDEIKSGR